MERLILSNQYEILSKLAENEYEKKDYQTKREIFVQGYEYNYDDATEYFADLMSKEDSEFVWNVLEMYRAFQNAYTKDPENIDEKAISFQGFDGNSTTNYYSYCKFVIHEMDRYAEFKKIDLNSHGNYPREDTLKIWVSRWKEIIEKRRENQVGYMPLSAEDIKKIIA